ncbi:competence protein ComK [Alkalibacillus flavidus]|uniref:Competence protein ComK n=1 Tax=Alkalibacillus flavidus TaxID=546021 RepID=A0ABV2KXD4_9BACI
MQDIKKLNNYIINGDTMVIKHYEESVYRSWILERETAYLCIQTPEQILDESCKRKGLSTYAGRKKAVADLLEKKTRLPVPIEIDLESIFLPTTLKKRERSDWIAYKYIKEIKPSPNGDFFNRVVLTNNQEVDLEISFTTFNKQMMYAGYLVGYFFRKDDIC